MATLLDVPFFCFPFMLLVQLSVISKECYHRCEDALRLKDRGHELINHLRATPYQLRIQKLSTRMTALDAWHMWMHLASQALGPTQPCVVVFKAAPMTVDVCTAHNCPIYDMEVSSQHIINLGTPYMLLGTGGSMLYPTVYDAVVAIKSLMTVMLGHNVTYSEVWWRTSPLTLFELDMAHMVCYQYADVTVSHIDGDTSLSIPHRRVRVPEGLVRGHLAMLADFV